MNESGHMDCEFEYRTYQIQHIKHEFAHGINEIRHIACKIINILDGFGHGPYIFGCNMNEYRHIIIIKNSLSQMALQIRISRQTASIYIFAVIAVVVIVVVLHVYFCRFSTILEYYTVYKYISVPSADWNNGCPEKQIVCCAGYIYRRASTNCLSKFLSSLHEFKRF